MKTCPSCKNLNTDDSYYCHVCGRKLKGKINGWTITSILLFIILCIVSVLLYDFYDKLYYSESKVSLMDADLSAKEDSITNLQTLIQSQNVMISNLQQQLPQIYYTKYPNQKIYYWAGSFIETTYTWSNSGVAITIYMQKDEYGMTEWGWIPMNCLRR